MSVRATLESEQVGLADRVTAANSSAPEMKTARTSSFRTNWQAELASNNSENESFEAKTTILDQDASRILLPNPAASLPTPAGSLAARTASSAPNGADPKSGLANLIANLMRSSKAAKMNPDKHDFMQLNMSSAERQRSFSLHGYKVVNDSGQGSGKDRTQNESDQEPAASISPLSNQVPLQSFSSPVAFPNQIELNARTAATSTAHLDKVAVASITLVEQQSEGPNSIPPSVIGTPAGSDATNEVRAAAAGNNALASDRMPKAENDAEPHSVPARPDGISGLAIADQKTIRNSEFSEVTERRNSADDLYSDADTLQSAGSGWSRGAGNQLKVSNASADVISGTQSRTLATEPSPNEVNGSIQMPPQADLTDPTLNPGRDAGWLAESQTSQSNAGSAALTGKSAPAKQSTPRLVSNFDRGQSFKQAMSGPSDAFIPHSFGGSHISEITEAGIVMPKSTSPASNDVRIQEAFTALESGNRAENGTFGWSRGGHIQAEAGYQDPVLGWVGVRAESSGGIVHATLVPPSQDAAQALSGHMAGLHTYLAENHTPVETLNLAPFGRDSQDMTQNTGQGMRHGTGQHSGHDNVSEPAQDPQSSGHPIGRYAPRTTSISNEFPTLSSAGRNSRGTHISVMA
jgi:hypothetical protein